VQLWQSIQHCKEADADKLHVSYSEYVHFFTFMSAFLQKRFQIPARQLRRAIEGLPVSPCNMGSVYSQCVVATARAKRSAGRAVSTRHV
jgi:hypothetical protein